MIRRNARQRREYLHKKASEIRQNKINEKKNKIENSLQTGKTIHGNLQREAVELQDKLKYNTGKKVFKFSKFI